LKLFTFASYALYFLGGLVMTTIGSVLPKLIEHYGLTYTESGQLVFLGSAGFLIGVPFSSFLLKKISEKAVLSLAASFVAIAQLVILLLPPFGWVLVFNFLNGLGTAAFEIVVATLMMELFVGRRAIVMSYLEVAFGLGALLMPLIASLFIFLNIWRFSFLITSALAVLMAFTWAKIPFPVMEEDHSKPLDASSPPPAFIDGNAKWILLSLFVLMIFMYGGLEGSLNNFLSSIFINYFKETPSFSSLSVGVFWVTMVIGRLATGWIIRKVTYSRYLVWSMLATLTILVLFILLNNNIAGYIFVGILGLTMSGVYSITLVYANHSLPGLARLVTSFITGFAGLGGAVFPALIGFTMDHTATSVALWCITGFVGVYLLALSIIQTLHKKFLKNNEVLKTQMDIN
jgi:MFS transporter, FHS family, glucose/mannose:H+ symporter